MNYFQSLRRNVCAVVEKNFSGRNAAKLPIVATLALLSIATTLNNPSYAGRFGQNHPRRAEVLRRDNSLNQQLQNDRGNLGGNYGRLEHEDQRIRAQEQRDAHMNGGYITQGQQAQLNHEESRMQMQMNQDYRGAANPGSFASRHPRRSQVLGDDRSLNQQINSDRGQLNGHYGQLANEDQRIRAQEQRDARQNGGYITTQQQQHLDNEETRLQNQINRDH
ncbi:MAG TPA: hypothetical protein V6C72_13560 [Chroococcales cyanobacterium]